MKVATTGLTILLVALSIWMWVELRDTWHSFNQHVVSTEYSRLAQARKLEGMLREGRIDDALSHLQRNRDVYVIGLPEVISAIDKPSWRWKRNTQAVEQARKTLRIDAEYRRTHGQSDGKLADQAAKALEGY